MRDLSFSYKGKYRGAGDAGGIVVGLFSQIRSGHDHNGESNGTTQGNYIKRKMTNGASSSNSTKMDCQWLARLQ